MMYKQIIRHKADCYLLRAYNEVTGEHCYYIFTSEGDIIAQDLHGGTRIPSAIRETFEHFSMDKLRERNRGNFLSWLEREGYIRGKNEIQGGKKGK